MSSAVCGLLISDVDSTFLTQEVIELVADHAGVRPQVQAITEAAMRGELDFADSLRRRVALLEGLGVGALSDVRAALVPTPGAVDLMRRARAAGWVTALVSGGFHEAIDELAESVGIDHVVANRFEVRDGALTGRLDGPIISAAAKKRTLEHLAARYDVPREHIVAVGDGANDRQLLQAAGTGIAFRAKPALREIADVCIDGGFEELWPHLEAAVLGE